MKIVTVIPFEKGPGKRDLTYFTSKEIPDGSIVEITLRNRKLLGLAVSSVEATEAKGELKELDFNLKKILGIKENPIIKSKYIEAVLSTSKYFVSRENDSIAALLPSLLIDNYDLITTWKLKKNILNNPSKELRIEKLLFQADFEDRISFYKTLIRSSFAEKKSIFIVLPTEKAVKEFEDILKKGIEQFTFSFSGGTTRTQKALEKLRTMSEMDHPVLVLGTAIYLSLPRYDFGTIIIEEESSSAYRMPFSPWYDLRVFVEIFAAKINAKLILCDTLLRFETFARKELDDFGDVSSLSFRIGSGSKLEILERQTERNKRSFSVFTEDNIRSIKNSLKKEEKVFIFALRKGLATYTVCRDCNDILLCDNCSAPLVLYSSKDGKKRMFACNRCGKGMDPDTRCRLCGSWNLMPLGIGLDAIYEELEKHFPRTKIFKIDKEEAESSKKAEAIAKSFGETPGSILLGTQMALFYLRDPADVSIIASFDTLWSIPNFQMGERVVRLISSILQKTEKRLIVITKNINDPALIALQNENLLSYARSELADRKNLGYPPYKRFIKISHSGSKTETTEVRKFLTEFFKDYEIDIFTGFVAKERDKYSTNAIIKLDRKKWSYSSVVAGGKIDEVLFSKLSSLPPIFTISIDPENLL